MIVWDEPISFQWDKGNSFKNSKHQVENTEIEESFFDQDKVVALDRRHSQIEQRHILLGFTKQKRLLYVVFTVRKGIVRVISARDINKKERYLYEKSA
jgi:uncharacterized DUF497 family protein